MPSTSWSLIKTADMLALTIPPMLVARAEWLITDSAVHLTDDAARLRWPNGSLAPPSESA
jgi:hypothetical protein